MVDDGWVTLASLPKATLTHAPPLPTPTQRDVANSMAGVSPASDEMVREPADKCTTRMDEIFADPQSRNWFNLFKVVDTNNTGQVRSIRILRRRAHVRDLPRPIVSDLPWHTVAYHDLTWPIAAYRDRPWHTGIDLLLRVLPHGPRSAQDGARRILRRRAQVDLEARDPFIRTPI